jgi:hypothetical protein
VQQPSITTIFQLSKHKAIETWKQNHLLAISFWGPEVH